MLLNYLINTIVFALPTALPKLENEDGQDLAEYALVLVFVSIAAIAALTALGPAIANIYTQISAALSGGGGGGI